MKTETIDLRERVKVTYTDKAPAYITPGRVSEVHPKVAEKLKKKGWIK
jgi:hypothetical protein